MKYSSAYLLQVAQNGKTTPPIPPHSPYEALMAVLEAGFALKRHPSGRGVLVVDAAGVAQPWPELPAQMESFLDLTFLVMRRDEAQVTECWCPDELVKQGLMALGWPEERIWTREELGERMGK
ncbi:MAG: hypothetical protein ACFHW5_00055 [Verrucomicrobiota bacterium]